MDYVYGIRITKWYNYVITNFQAVYKATKHKGQSMTVLATNQGCNPLRLPLVLQ